MPATSTSPATTSIWCWGRPRNERGSPYVEAYSVGYLPNALTVDFVSGAAQSARKRPSAGPNTTIVAMFLNNRAAELLVGRVRLTMLIGPHARRPRSRSGCSCNAYNTLGRDLPAPRQPRRCRASRCATPTRKRSNNTIYPGQSGANAGCPVRSGQAGRSSTCCASRLAQLEPVSAVPLLPPRTGSHEGWATTARARKLFERVKLERVPDYHEFHFWLAMANYQLGNLRAADKHMAQGAVNNSTTRGDHDLYCGQTRPHSCLRGPIAHKTVIRADWYAETG